MTLSVESPRVYTSQGVPITVSAVAQIKIQGQNQEMLLTACEQFLGKSSIREIEKVALETLEGHQRAIMGALTVEVNYQKITQRMYFISSFCRRFIKTERNLVKTCMTWRRLI